MTSVLQEGILGALATLQAECAQLGKGGKESWRKHPIKPWKK